MVQARETGAAGLPGEAPLYPRRFARHIGRLCEQATIGVVAREPKLDWDPIKALVKQCMRGQRTSAERRFSFRAFPPGTYHSMHSR